MGGDPHYSNAASTVAGGVTLFVMEAGGECQLFLDKLAHGASRTGRAAVKRLLTLQRKVVNTPSHENDYCSFHTTSAARGELAVALAHSLVCPGNPIRCRTEHLAT